MKKPKTHRLGIRVEEEFHQKLQRLAESHRRELSDTIRIILEDEIDRYESQIHEKPAAYGSKKSPPSEKSTRGAA